MNQLFSRPRSLGLLGASLLLLTPWTPGAWAQQDQTPAKQTETVDSLSLDLPSENQESSLVSLNLTLTPWKANPGDEVTLTVAGTVAPGWHIYPIDSGNVEIQGLPTKIRFRSSSLRAQEKAYRLVNSESADPSELSGRFKWERKYKLKPKSAAASGRGSITFQVCNEEGCLPPTTLEFDFADRVKEETLDFTEFKLLGKPITIPLRAAEKSRTKVKLTLSNFLLGGATGGLPTEKLGLHGQFPLQDKKVDIYLRKRRRYQLVNKNPSNIKFDNQSEYISIDFNGDGEISDTESFGVNLPIRMGDSMFKVLKLDQEQLVLQQADVPLAIAIEGQKCPPFKYTSTEGESITDTSLLGKVTILDIWAVT